MAEAFRMVEVSIDIFLCFRYLKSSFQRGDATPKDIDIAMKLGAGYPMGKYFFAKVKKHI